MVICWMEPSCVGRVIDMAQVVDAGPGISMIRRCLSRDSCPSSEGLLTVSLDGYHGVAIRH